jgi:hypothetical protein
LAGISYRLRAELRARWRALAAIALLAGIAGGITLVALAGARRADSAFTRLLATSSAADVLVNPDLGTGSALDSAAVVRFPQVAQAGRVDGFFIARADARSDADYARFGSILASDGRVGYAFARPKILDGRMPRPDRADEILVNSILARREHLAPGDRVKANGFSATATESVNGGAQITPLTLHVVGVGVFPDEIVVDQSFDTPSIFLTPAFRRVHASVKPGYFGVVARLHGGAATVPAFRRAVEALAPNEALAFQTSTNTQAKVDRAVQPQVGALSVFAIVMGLTGLLVVGQAVARETFVDGTDNPTLRAIGYERRQLFALAMVRVVLIAVGGAALAVLLAIALSPLLPIGAARIAEPHPGVAVDALVLVLGALALIVAVVAVAIVPAWQAARRAATSQENEVLRPSRLVGALMAAGFPTPAVTGVRMAVEPGRGRTAVPVRTTVVSALLAIATVVAALVVAASLDHLVDTPRLYGWNWDTQITVTPPGQANSAGDDALIAASRTAVGKVLTSAHPVAQWSTVSLSDVRLATGSVPAVGIDPGRRVAPTLVSGRLPGRDDEIALGARTLRALGASDGAVIRARANDGSARQLHVVGRVVLPGLGTYNGSDKTALGEGAVVTEHALRQLGPRFTAAVFVVDFRASASAAARQRVLVRAFQAGGSSDPGNFQVRGVQRPSDILSYEKVRGTPIVLAALLALLAAATVAHALASSVRRRRRDFALLKTLGLTRRQISGTVAWQATTVAVVALVVGIPIGIVLGRWGWASLADNLGTVADPIVPAIVVGITVPLVLVLVNLVALAPGRHASRLAAAAVLRSE